MGRIRGCSIVMVVCAKTAMISGVLRMGGGGRYMQRRCSFTRRCFNASMQGEVQIHWLSGRDGPRHIT